MRSHDDEDGMFSEIRSLITELQNDADRLNAAASAENIDEGIQQQIAGLADKIDGLQSLLGNLLR
ncbi:hypothetical protein ACFFGF_05380 [Asaia lannensis]|uniref:Uncharacterized protein n=1 Tax=Asaia lannensis NBRC 102526 TaxID=1307926 RepID=A0ABT1CJA6_9PROT|nr:hypothetical protein [Asaia lannensis]MCO6160954.1 hypothetical protein [Asaia lannensis NBRC 102526]GBR02394.1 hypothetical protein AA102526_2817 [Asaia lannensis NBRC 102526]